MVTHIAGERRLRLFENRVLRMIFRYRRDEVTGEWRRLHNEKLYAVHSSLNIIRVIKSGRLRWAWQVARMRERRGAVMILVKKREGSNHWKRLRSSGQDNIKMNLREM